MSGLLVKKKVLRFRSVLVDNVMCPMRALLKVFVAEEMHVPMCTNGSCVSHPCTLTHVSLVSVLSPSFL